MSNNEHESAPEDALDASQEMHAGAVGREAFVSLRGTQSLERLRERVDAAARELERLRQDNLLLARRIAELEARPDVGPDQVFLTFDEDQETMRRKVQVFIHAIDAHLAKSRETES